MALVTRARNIVVSGVLIAMSAACGGPVPSPREAAVDPTPVPLASCPDVARLPTLPPDVPQPLDLVTINEAETHRIVQAFLDDLARWYDDPATLDRCRVFTDAGWNALLSTDWRARDVAAGELRFGQSHILRAADELENSALSVPPRLSFEVVFDIPAGATARDAGTGATVSTQSGPERTGFSLVFIFDGRDWRADSVAPLTADTIELTALPPPVGPARRCSGYRDDAGRQRPFDNDPNRPWCDGGASGRQIQHDEQLAMLTRYPCDRGHAAILFLGDELGGRLDPLVNRDYVRDPANEFLAQGWIREPYEGDATLPPTAFFTGWSNGNIALWVDPETWEKAVYVVRGKTVERWPRAAHRWGVTDCN